MPCAPRAPIVRTVWETAVKAAAPQDRLAVARRACNGRSLAFSGLFSWPALGLLPYALSLLTLALCLLSLANGPFSAFLALDAAEIAQRCAAQSETTQTETAQTPAPQTPSTQAGNTALAVPAGAEASPSTSFGPAAHASRMSVDRGAPWQWSVEFENAEFDQEDEEESFEDTPTDAPESAAPDFSRAPSAKFRGAASTFVTRIGDFRKLPRAPPARA